LGIEAFVKLGSKKCDRSHILESKQLTAMLANYLGQELGMKIISTLSDSLPLFKTVEKSHRE
jgi:hypothetical protein